MNIYRMALNMQRKLGTISTWSIVIDKQKWETRSDLEQSPEAIRARAWEYLIQRIERFSNYGNDRCVLFPDEGHPEFVKRLVRKMRRHNEVFSAFTEGKTLSRPATFIVDDPNFRVSHESYFIQLADLNGYAAYRACFPEPFFDGRYWERLGDARVAAVSRNRPGIAPTGIVRWPYESPTLR